MNEQEHTSTPSEHADRGARQDWQGELTEITTLSYERESTAEHVYHAWQQHFHTVPCVFIRGDVDFIEPGSKPGKWRKKRTVELKEWHHVKQWEHENTGRMLIDYTFSKGPSRSQSETKEQWIRPMEFFDSWPFIQFRRNVADTSSPQKAL